MSIRKNIKKLYFSLDIQIENGIMLKVEISISKLIRLIFKETEKWLSMQTM